MESLQCQLSFISWTRLVSRRRENAQEQATHERLAGIKERRPCRAMLCHALPCLDSKPPFSSHASRDRDRDRDWARPRLVLDVPSLARCVRPGLWSQARAEPLPCALIPRR